MIILSKLMNKYMIENNLYLLCCKIDYSTLYASQWLGFFCGFKKSTVQPPFLWNMLSH